MDRILEATVTLSTKFDGHSAALIQAKNITDEILDSLEGTVATALSINESFFNSATTKSWWPFVICPTASLVFGSYGLPPSILRNFGLLAFGEAIGFAISSYTKLTIELFAIYNSATAAKTMASEVITNVTNVIDLASSL